MVGVEALPVLLSNVDCPLHLSKPHGVYLRNDRLVEGCYKSIGDACCSLCGDTASPIYVDQSFPERSQRGAF